MTIQEQIQADFIIAMKSRDTEKLGVLRMLKASLGTMAIEKKTPELDDATTLGVIRKNIKTRQESAEAFTKGNRPELADKEKAEITILEAYLPPQLEPHVVEELVKTAIQHTGAKTRKDMGIVMKDLSQRIPAGQVDGKILSAEVQKALAAV